MRESEAIDRIINAIDEAEAALTDNAQIALAEAWLNISRHWVHVLKEVDITQDGDEAVEEEAEDEDDEESYEDDEALEEIKALWEASDEEDTRAPGGPDEITEDPDDVARLGPVEPI